MDFSTKSGWSVFIEGSHVMIFKKNVFLSLKQTVQILMKCRVLWHFIWVFIVCKGTRLGVSILLMVKPNNAGSVKMPRSWCLHRDLYYNIGYWSTLCRIVLFGVGSSKENTHKV